MDEFAKSKPADRRILFEAAAAPLNIAAALVEKDFWVCWTLKELFRLPIIGSHLIFKGGTSLSKVFKAIERFSEDIDISIDREFLGFGGANDPEAGTGNKDRQRRIDALKSACQQKIAGELLPALKSAVRAKLGRGEQWALRQDDDDPDQQTLLFEYPTVFPQATSQYIRRAVKIEMGARSDHWPSETKFVTAFVAERFPQAFGEPSCAVKVLSAERTFWEKATILHAEFHRPVEKPIPERFSRHYYDFSKLIRKGVADDAAKQLDLLERVAKHKGLFFRSSWAKHETAAKGTLRLAPQDYRIQPLREDYAIMREMFFGEPPTFDEILETIRVWERKFNRK
jgi:predicted nucleotidyltransferase component of viral defense system